MSTYDVLLVNPSTVAERPHYARTGNIFTPAEVVVRSFNPGLLSIASYLASKGIEVKIVDLLDESDHSALVSHLQEDRPRIAGISCISGFSYPSALLAAEQIKEAYPDTVVALGGSHAGPLASTIWHDTSHVDVVGLFEGERVMLDLVERVKKHEPLAGIPGTVVGQDGMLHINNSVPSIDINELPLPHWSLYPHPERFVPYLEESRGCYGHCSFCMSNFQYFGKLRAKSPERFDEEVEHAHRIFGSDNTYALLASTFGAELGRTLAFIRSLNARNIRWTTEVRVDVPWESYLDEAAESGLTVLNASPESGSPEILLRIQKTSNPEKYLRKASSLIKASAQISSMILKLNFLFYAGETAATLKETLGFTFDHAASIRSVSFAPLMVYPGTETSRRLQQYRDQFGTEIIQDPYWNKLRIFPAHLSREFTFHDISALCRILDKVFNTRDDFFRTMEYKYGTDSDRVRDAVIKAKFEE